MIEDLMVVNECELRLLAILETILFGLDFWQPFLFWILEQITDFWVSSLSVEAWKKNSSFRITVCVLLMVMPQLESPP